ncbi:hypothetical protein [Flavobacterium chungangense]|uniref:Uncharacterized protein n=1 Tax=Flavobacterium chungangense TaxID=554283 RepID=A0A6V6YM28_9FLAO|nr:hypothetical protein [Flavobacterium chungangense]CAD0000394.1 hypothetical protein FLACHUCJ7_00013 [Flavobacterium chungangense]
MKKHSVTINKITCNSASEIGHDEVYLKYQSDAGVTFRIPKNRDDSESMKSGNTWVPVLLDPNGSQIPLTIYFDYEALVTLWDKDETNLYINDTYLQSYDFRPGSGSGQVRLSNLNGQNYSIEYTYNK